MAKIILNRKAEFRDRARSYNVMVDKIEIGKINHGETKEFDIAPGNHTIYLKVDWCRSNIIEFTLKENEISKFECGNSMIGLKILLSILYITFMKNSYLWIKKK